MKITFNFLNRWEYALFSSYNVSHSPISKTVATYALVAAVAVVIALFITQMANVADAVFETQSLNLSWSWMPPGGR
jgi:hypothetical protein